MKKWKIITYFMFYSEIWIGSRDCNFFPIITINAISIPTKKNETFNDHSSAIKPTSTGSMILATFAKIATPAIPDPISTAVLFPAVLNENGIRIESPIPKNANPTKIITISEVITVIIIPIKASSAKLRIIFAVEYLFASASPNNLPIVMKNENSANPKAAMSFEE